MKIFTRGTVVAIVLFTLTILISIYVYPILPDQMISHWGPNGEANGYMGKFWGTFLLPLIMLVVFLVMLVVPRIDPKKKNIEAVRGSYDAFLILLMVLFLVLQKFILGVNLGFQIDSARFFPFIFSLFFISLGFIIERLKQNWTIGIRTPWTLSSEYVWDKTHVFGGKIFKICGVIASFGVIFPTISFLVFLVPLLIGLIVVFIYSYRLFKKEQK